MKDSKLYFQMAIALNYIRSVMRTNKSSVQRLCQHMETVVCQILHSDKWLTFFVTIILSPFNICGVCFDIDFEFFAAIRQQCKDDS